MAGPADRFRAAAARGRKAVDRLGLRITTVTIRVETYSAAWNTAGATLLSTVDTILTPSPKVVQAGIGAPSFFGGGTVADSGDTQLNAGVYDIGPITPQYVGGGYTVAQLAPPSSSSAVRVSVILAGAEFQATGERFDISDVNATNALHTMMTVTRAVQT